MKTLLLLLSLAFVTFAQAVEIISSDFSKFDEDKALGPKNSARLYALDKLEPEKEPLILVHGIMGEPANMQTIVRQLKASRFQIYVLAYAEGDHDTILEHGPYLEFLEDELNFR